MLEISNPPKLVFSISELKRMLVLQMPLILGIAFLSLTVAMAITATVTPLYEGRAVVAIDLRNRNPVEVSTQVEALRAHQVAADSSDTGRCSYQERNGVVTIRCEGTSSADTMTSVKRGLADVMAIGDGQLADWSRFAESLREIKAGYESNELAIIGRSTSSQSFPLGSAGRTRERTEIPTLAMIQLSQATMFEKIVRLEIALRKASLFPPRVLVEPRVSNAPVRPHWMRNAMFAFLLGTLLGLTIAFLRVMYNKAGEPVEV